MLLVFAVWLLAAFGPAPPPEPGFAPVAVAAAPVAQFRIGSDEAQFGDLTFLGGLALAASDRAFGSLSGVDFLPDGRTLIAVADTGFFLHAKLDETPDHRPLALRDAALGPILGEDGLPPARKWMVDAEGVRLTDIDGVPAALVTFEGRAALRAFAGPDFARAVPRPLPLPRFVDRIPRNQGLEAVAVAPGDGILSGAIVVIAEQALDDTGNHRGFILSGPERGSFAIVRSDGFDVTDAAFLPSGDLVVLERRFAPLAGFAMRLRLIDAAELRAGATVTGRVLLEADDRAFAVDNMEGLAARALPDGAAILTLVSDDNGSVLQKTLLLQFRLAAPH